jgi:hypothetical protein
VLTAGELRTEAERLRDIAGSVTDPDLLAMIRELVDEFEVRARELDNGA